MICLVLINSILNPLEISFNDKEKEINMIFRNLDNVVLGIYLIDLIFSCRTTYFDENGDEILNSKRISVKYLKSVNFAMDFSSSLPITQIIQSLFDDNNNKFVKFINLLKIVRLLRISRLMNYISEESLKIIYKMMKLILIIVVLVNKIKNKTKL